MSTGAAAFKLDDRWPEGAERPEAGGYLRSLARRVAHGAIPRLPKPAQTHFSRGSRLLIGIGDQVVRCDDVVVLVEPAGRRPRGTRERRTALDESQAMIEFSPAGSPGCGCAAKAPAGSIAVKSAKTA